MRVCCTWVRRFLQELQSVSAAGTGPLGLVSFEISGTANWRCEIAAGVLHRLTEQDFVAEATSAACDLLRTSRYEKALLKNEFYGTRHAPPFGSGSAGAPSSTARLG